MLAIGDVVEFGRNSFDTAPAFWRIDAFYRLETYEPRAYKTIEDGRVRAVLRIVDYRLLCEKLGRLERGEPASARIRYVACLPEAASHVGLYSLCGRIAPIQSVRFVRSADENAATDRANYDALIPILNERIEWEWE